MFLGVSILLVPRRCRGSGVPVVSLAAGFAAFRPRGTFLCLSKETCPKERTPHRPRRSLRERSPAGAPCSGGASTGHPCPDDACSTSCLAPRCARHPTRRFRRGPNSGISFTNALRAFVRAFDVAVPPVTSAPSSAARAVGRLAMDGQSSAVTAGTPCRRDPEHVSSAGSPARAARRGADVSGVLSFGSFSLDKQRKGTRRRGAPEPVGDVAN